MFGETTISYVKIGNHPIETTIYKWLFGVPGRLPENRGCLGNQKGNHRKPIGNFSHFEATSHHPIENEKKIFQTSMLVFGGSRS